MAKRILLVEPAYKTKYPPLGLMKISTYHKMKGDEVVFVKGCRKDVQYEYWDRVYISTLFTWTWNETVKTINFYRETLFNLAGKCFVGGILASLMPQELFNATGIQPVEGLLNEPAKIAQDDDLVVDELPPDYEILTQVETNGFKYLNTDAYIGYSTRGCVWHCDFCAVCDFEPHYVPYIDIKASFRGVTAQSGEKQNLVLMDNNVLASRKFDQITDDIKSLGFEKGATFGKTRRKRRVDFNQGLDARFLTEEKMQRLSEIPLEPMRLAFDSMDYKETYVKAVRIANKFGQKDMSSYVLYNFKDSPEDFYERLRLIIDLNHEFKTTSQVKTHIYAFPMRFIPLDAKSRDVDTGNQDWNKRYLRGLQVILNVMSGPVMPGRQFFMQAFGRCAEEFKDILLMPDEFIRNRLVSDWKKIDDADKRVMPYVTEWMETLSALSPEEKVQLVNILAPNDKETIKEARDRGASTQLTKLLGCHLEEDEIVRKHRTG